MHKMEGNSLCNEIEKKKSTRISEKLKRYEKIEFLGEGQFATVYKALDLENEEIVAVKKIKLGSREEARDGINRTALREVKLLQEVQHENILSLCDVFGFKSNISLVFDFMDTDLEVIIKDTENIILTSANIKSYLIQTLKGLEFLHLHWILHRDMKPSNLLVNKYGILKIGDFGLARFFGSPNRPYSHQVVTRWYRAPELLFGARAYGTGVDLWSVGCILAEMLVRCPYFPGDSDLDQLTKIFTALGSPVMDEWPEMCNLPDYITFKEYEGSSLTDLFPAASDSLLQVLGSMLQLNPLKRGTCKEILKMSYFSDRPPPTPGLELPLPASVKLRKTDTSRHSLKRRLLEEVGGSASLAKRLQF